MAHHSYHQSCSIPSIIILTFVFLAAAATAAAANIPYHPHCDSVVPQPKSTTTVGSGLSSFLSLQSGYFSGGEALFKSLNANSTPLAFPKSISVRHSYIYRTETPGVFQLQSTLIFRGGSIFQIGNSTRFRMGRKGYQVYPSGHRGRGFFQRPGTVTFNLQGFWSEASGKLCMVGTGFGYSKEGKLLSLSAVFKLNYPKISNISTTLVTGTVESVDAADSLDFFDKISVVAYAQKSYEYTLIDRKDSVCDGNDGGGEKSIGLDLEQDIGICSTLTRLGMRGFHLDYEGDCGKKKCGVLSERVGFLPSIMTIGGVGCSDKGKLQMFVQFPNKSSYSYRAAFDPERILVGEGVWDEEKKQACFVACRVLETAGSLENTSVGDCSIGLTIRFPKILSAKVRSFAVGHIWSNKKRNDTGYFDRIAFRSVDNRVSSMTGLKYEYAEMAHLSEPCGKKKVIKSGNRYPDGDSVDDMRFDFSVKDKRKSIGWGDSSPLTVGDRFYPYPYGSSESQMTADQVHSNNSRLNISYLITLTLDGKWGGLSLNQTSSFIQEPIEVAAEGVYDAKTGTLCMVGCRHLSLAGKSLAKNGETIDCTILINVEFAPFNPDAGRHLKGTIKSTRGKSDPLFFEPLELSSNVLYTSEAQGTIRRMDVEIVMILISLMLACVFIGLQLFYVKKHPDVLPSLSLIMLVVLTLGHMIPLVLNFEAFLFSNHSRQNMLLWSGGWLEVNEVVVRVVTMVAFLLQFRLLQLVWSARLAEESKRGLWASEKKALWLCLPLYIAGGLIALIVHWKMNEATQPGPLYAANSQHSIWEDLRSYAGLILDGFLLPQILLNIFCNSQDRALSLSFYIGTTIVRSLPHAYDAYRAHEYGPRVRFSYIYANPDADLYSPAWDIIIPCAGLFFAIIIYLQQRFGGAFMLPQRCRPSSQYEKVPVVSG